MLRFRTTIFGAMILAVGLTATAQDKAQKALATLTDSSPPQEKALACKQLAIYGGKEAVPALAALLADEQLQSWARIALEAIPDAEAGAALREAAGKLKGRPLVGAILSLGARRDDPSTVLLIAHLKGPDANAASAAAWSLGRIGGEPAVGALKTALAGSAPALRAAAAEGCILCAERLLAEKKTAEAVAVYEQVRQAQVSKQQVREAIRGLILAKGAAGIPLLVEQLQSADKAAFALGVQVARECSAAEATDALAAELAKAAPERRPLLIAALADRGDAKAGALVTEAATSGPAAGRVAAIKALKRFPQMPVGPVLLDAAFDADESVAAAAMAILTDWPGKELNDAILARLTKAEGAARLALIRMAGLRSVAAAVPELSKASQDADAAVRLAAIQSLGEAVAFSDLAILIELASREQAAAGEIEAAVAALREACRRMPDQEACAAKVVESMAGASTEGKCRFLKILEAVGGQKALATIGEAAKSSEPALQDAATQLLGAWMSLDAAPVLLDLAKTAKELKYETRAIRGYIRLLRQFDMPADQRAAMCRTAWDLAKRDDERRLVLGVCERYPSLDAMRLAVEALNIPTLKNEATRASLAVAQKLGGGSPEMKKLLDQVGQKPMKIEILKAEYGEGTRQKDVTELLRKHVIGFPLIVLPTQYNASFGGDPAPGVVKKLRIKYQIEGKPGEALFDENATISLPIPK